MFTKFGDPEFRLAWRERFFDVATSSKNVQTDMEAMFALIDADPDVRRGAKVGCTGYCMGGHVALKLAGLFGERVGACGSFHGGFLGTESPDSPHRFVGGIKGRLYLGAATDDPSVTDDMRERLQPFQGGCVTSPRAAAPPLSRRGEGLSPRFQVVCHLSANEAPSPRRERGRTEVEGEVTPTAVFQRIEHLERGGERLFSALKHAKVDFSMEVYPARHGWCVPDSPSFDSASAERHYASLAGLLASLR